MNTFFSLLYSQKRQMLALGAAIFIIFAVFLVINPNAVQAQIYQFSPGDKNYAAAVYIAAAQEANEKVDVEKKITLDEDIVPEDFGLKSTGLLPTSPFYFLKDLRRSITSFLTFDDVKEAELKLQFASEKLLETKALAEKGNVDERIIRIALDNFRKELERVKSQAERASENAEGEEAERLARKLMDSVLKYQKFLGKIEKELPPDALEDVMKTKETASEAFSKVFNLAEPEKVGEELVQIIDEQKGSDFKHFKNIEVLKEIEEKVPEEARDAIRIAQENALNRLQQELEKFEEAKRAIFEDFVRETGGSEARHLEILSELEVMPVSEDVRAAILAAKEEVIGKTEKRLESLPSSAKELLLAPLAKGRFEDLRLVQELENTVTSAVARDVVSAIKQKSIAEFGEKVKRIDENEQAREELFKNVERFHDVKSLAVLDEIEKLVPEEKRETFRSLKTKAIEEIKNDIENARNEPQKEMIIDALAGDHPGYFKALENIKSDIPSDIDGIIAESIKKALFEVIQERVNVIQDKERLALFEREFEQNRQYIGGEPRDVNLEEFFTERRVAFEDPERVRNAVKRAEEAVNELRAIVNSLPFEYAAPEGRIDPALKHIEELFTLSQKKLEGARFYFDKQDLGRAFGMAESAFSLAENGARFAKDYKAGYRKSIVEEEKSPFSDFFVPPYNERRAVPQEFRIFNQYEFQQFCIFAKGSLKQSLVCAFPDGRVLKADQSGFPFVVPPEFLPEHFRPSIQPEETSLVCPPLPKTPPFVCPDGQYREIILDERGCETFGECRVPDEQTEERLFCDAFWQGYVFDSKTKSCFLESDTGCADPFIYHTKEECEKAAGAVSQAICPSLPTVDSCPAGEEKFVVFSSPECGTYYGCRSQELETKESACGDNICESGETSSSCPSDCGSASAFSEMQKCFYPNASRNGQSLGTVWCERDYFNCHEGDPTGPEVPLDGLSLGAPSSCESGWPTVGSVCNYNNVCEDSENRATCPLDCGSQSSWDEHTWIFSDGQTKSMIFNRTDSDYLDYIASIEAQCAKITKDKFVWKPNAGDDRPENWQNFGIPDCSGSAIQTTYACGDNICESGETPSSCPSDCGSASAFSEMQKCLYPNASRNGQSLGTVWCERDYFNCHEGDPTGPEVPLDGLSLGAPSSCESGWDSGTTDSASGETSGSSGSSGGTSGGSCYNAYADQASCESSGCVWYQNHYDGTHCDDAAHGQTSGSSGSSGGTSGDTTNQNTQVNHTWTFSDGQTASSMILNRTDSDYLDYISSIEAQCAKITKDKFAWKPNAGDPSSENWQNFGIPDCSGNATTPTYVCGNNLCESGETTSSCPSDCGGGTTSVCPSGSYEATLSGITMSGVCVRDGVTCPDTGAWAPSCPNGPFAWDSNGCPTSCQTTTTDTACNYNNVCDSNESYSSCPSDCGGGGTSASACGDNVCDSSESQYSCSADCGLASDRCNGGTGNGVCEAGEDYWNCYVDCPQ